MSLTDIQAVRLRSSDKSRITREQDTADGVQNYWKLGHSNIFQTPDIQVRLDGVLQVAGFTVDYVQGIVSFDSPPANGAELEFVYYWSIFSDDEIQYFIDDAAGNVAIAAAKVLLGIAADASKVAERQTMAGGGGMGSVTLDTSVTARELRNTAQAILDTEIRAGDVDTTIPSEGITEPIWTPMNWQEQFDQRIIRRN